ncbi:MAG: thiamine-phosphate pyrophosphorylase [Gracilibacter sp. BRH_c7a]|nr:MAG: thiamine-phosphate pyrophosphorylase [Gracilibacter sp. BRH_c7a]
MLCNKLEKMKSFSNGIYGITAEEHSRGRDNIEVVQEMMDAGIKVIQYREKEKSMLEKYRQCIRIREITAKAGAVFIVNDHVDLAMSVGADGIHIGQDDLPFKVVRELVGEDSLIGVSTHSPEQAQQAVRDGVDYIGVGPLFRTYTKKDVCEPVGLEYLEYVVGNINLPFVAIGGIKLHNLQEVKQKGARCISLVTEIVGAKDIAKTIQEAEAFLNK